MSTAQDLVERLTIRSLADIRPAAESLHQASLSLAGLRTAPSANIASKEHMLDSKGGVLASEVFGWVGPAQRWWG